MSFSIDDIFDVMADEICRGRRHVVDRETGVTVDDGLEIIGKKRRWKSDVWKRERKERRLSVSRRYQMRKDVAELLMSRSDISYSKAYYECNRELISKRNKERYSSDEEHRLRLLDRKRFYRKNSVPYQEHEKEYNRKRRLLHPEKKKEENSRRAEKERLIRKFIRESLCDDCLQTLHVILSSLAFHAQV